MDFILMLTRNDRTIEDAVPIVDEACDLGVRHIGFKDVGVASATMQDLVNRITGRGATCYLEVVSTSSDAVRNSLATGCALGVDCILGGTNLDAARKILGELSRYFPFAGRPVGHPTQLEGSAELVAQHAGAACAAGCAGVDLLAYRATQADPLELVRAARNAMPDGKLIVAGSIRSPQQVRTLAAAGVDAFTIGSALFDGSYSPAGDTLRARILDILGVCGDDPRNGGVDARGSFP